MKDNYIICLCCMTRRRRFLQFRPDAPLQRKPDASNPRRLFPKRSGSPAIAKFRTRTVAKPVINFNEINSINF